MCHFLAQGRQEKVKGRQVVIMSGKGLTSASYHISAHVDVCSAHILCSRLTKSDQSTCCCSLLQWLLAVNTLSGDLGCILASREVSCAVRVRGLHSLQLLLWWLFSAGARAFRGFPELQRLLRPQTFPSQLNRLSFLGDFGGNGFLLALIWRHGNSLRRKLLKVFLLTQTIFIHQVITYEGMQGSSHIALDNF